MQMFLTMHTFKAMDKGLVQQELLKVTANYPACHEIVMDRMTLNHF